MRWPDGQWRLIASRSIAVRDEQGQPTRRIGINWDITDTRAAQHAREEKLLAQRESQAKSEFLSRMSHELRTPLNAVLGFAQLLLGDGEKVSPDTRRRRLEQIQVAGQHLLSLINDVLDLSSLEGGEVRISLQPVALAALVAETLPLVARPARQRKVKLRSGALAGVALADATRLRQVLLNLLTNAVKYNREGGQVLVEAEQDGDTRAAARQRHRPRHERSAAAACLRALQPAGRGERRHRRHRHRPGHRQGAGRAHGRHGAGAQRARAGQRVRGAAARRRGGRRRRASPSSTRAAPPLLPDTHSGRTARLLYIEDNPVNLLIVQEVLAQRPDLQLDTAVDGLSGVSLAQSSRPDLILVDMQLPDIDGHEVLRRLRADAATAHIPCISLSANAMPDDIQRALQAGFADYWTKPLDLRRFLSSLETIFGAPG